jgi:hypothetical protein
VRHESRLGGGLVATKLAGQLRTEEHPRDVGRVVDVEVIGDDVLTVVATTPLS